MSLSQAAAVFCTGVHPRLAFQHQLFNYSKLASKIPDAITVSLFHEEH